MPNSENVEAPILVIGAVRCGSTWLLHVLNQHPAVHTLIENRLIESLYHEIFQSFWAVNWSWVCDEAELRHRAVHLARHALCTLFPSDRPAWGMKLLSRGRPWEFVRAVFPRARYIHLTRSPTTALPSMMEYVGNDYAVWQDLEHCQQEYVDAQQEALRLRDEGVPYLRVRQEDIAAEPADVWRRVLAFCELDFCAVPGLTEEINAAVSTRGQVKRGRPPLSWGQLSHAVHDISRTLGYLPSSAADSSSSASVVAGLEQQLEQLTTQRRELEALAAGLRSENRALHLALGRVADVLSDRRGNGAPILPGALREAAASARAALDACAGDLSNAPLDALAGNGRRPDGPVRMERIELLDGAGRRRDTFHLGDPIALEVELRAGVKIDNASVSFLIRDAAGIDVMGTTTFDERIALPPLPGGARVCVRFKFTNHLRPGNFGVAVAVNRVTQRDYSDNQVLDFVVDGRLFSVARHPRRPVHYVFHEPVSVTYELLDGPTH